jgi:hypothetical protein
VCLDLYTAFESVRIRKYMYVCAHVCVCVHIHLRVHMAYE